MENNWKLKSTYKHGTPSWFRFGIPSRLYHKLESLNESSRCLVVGTVSPLDIEMVFNASLSNRLYVVGFSKNLIFISRDIHLDVCDLIIVNSDLCIGFDLNHIAQSLSPSGMLFCVGDRSSRHTFPFREIESTEHYSIYER